MEKKILLIGKAETSNGSITYSNHKPLSEVPINKASAVIPNVAPEKVQEMIAYANNLKQKHPQYTPARLAKKVAEYFKVKLVD